MSFWLRVVWLGIALGCFVPPYSTSARTGWFPLELANILAEGVLKLVGPFAVAYFLLGGGRPRKPR